MKAKLLLRIAAIFLLLHTMGHTFGALGWANAPNSKVEAVIQAMQTEHFDFMGRSATLAQFYNGYGISMIFVLLFISIQLWLLSARPDKSMLLLMAMFLSVMVICEYVYFFPFAALFTLIGTICTWITFFKYEKI